MKLVINADDFGLTDGVCRAILDLLEQDAVTSTSLMIAAPGAIDRITKWNVSRLSGRVGVHLQLTGGSSISDPSNVKSLVDSNGRFRDARNSATSLAVDEVEREWRAQISVACNLIGSKPSHLDSHHGMHRRPELTGLYVNLARELGIPVRGGAHFLGNYTNDSGILTTEEILRDWTSKLEDEHDLSQKIRSIIEKQPSTQSIEIVTHPGFVDAELERVSSLVGPREFERQALSRFATTTHLFGKKLERISYSELANEPPSQSKAKEI